MFKVNVSPLSCALLFCGLAFGQTQPTTPPSPPTPTQHAARELAFMTQMLSLTPDQQSQAKTIFTKAASSESGVRASMHAAHQALQTAIENNDTAAISVAAEKIGQLTTQQITAHATAEAAFRAILTADQVAKLKTLHGFGHGPGPMGHGMPPMGPPPGE